MRYAIVIERRKTTTLHTCQIYWDAWPQARPKKKRAADPSKLLRFICGGCAEVRFADPRTEQPGRICISSPHNTLYPPRQGFIASLCSATNCILSLTSANIVFAAGRCISLTFLSNPTRPGSLTHVEYLSRSPNKYSAPQITPPLPMEVSQMSFPLIALWVLVGWCGNEPRPIPTIGPGPDPDPDPKPYWILSS